MRERDMAVIDRADDTIDWIEPDALLQDRPLLVLAPHPDDESLGCGALLAAAFAGPGAHVVCLTDGAASHPGSRTLTPARLAAIRRDEIEAAIRLLGGTRADLTWLGEPDGALEASDRIVATLAEHARCGGYGLCLAPSPLDPHCDHVAGAAIGRDIADRVPGLRMGYYPIWSRWHGRGIAPVPSGTRPVRLRSDGGTAIKRAAIAAHRSQAGQIVTDVPDGFEMPPGFADFFAKASEMCFLIEPHRDGGP